MSDLGLMSKVNLDAIVTLGLTNQVRIITLTSAVFKSQLFIKFPI